MESYPNGSVPVGGVLSTEHLPLPVFTATGCSTTTLLGGNSNGDSLSEIFLDQYTEVDMSSEWLSSFVEECLSSAGNCLPPPSDFEQKQNLTTTTTTNTNNTISTTNQKNPSSKPTKSIIRTTHKNTQPTHHHHQSFSVPGKPRSQRKRRTTTTTSTFISSAKTQITPLIRWAEHLNPVTEPLQLAFSDHPPLLEQAYWLADSELITLPRKEERKEDELKTNLGGGDEHEMEGEKKEKRKKKAELQEEEVGKENSGGGGEQQPRRCSHCQAQKTPQWRAGPLGPKTLCNACGVRYFKSGRLLPEYRPAKSPTFVSYKHSNSHKKVLQMRMALHQSTTTTSSTTSSSSPSSSPSSTLNNPNML